MSGTGRVSKRTIAELLGELFLPANADQIFVLNELADFDFNQDQTGWDVITKVTHGLLEHADLATVTAGQTFLVPGVIPADRIFSMALFANTPWIFLAVEQNLLDVNGGLRIKVVGTTD